MKSKITAQISLIQKLVGKRIHALRQERGLARPQMAKLLGDAAAVSAMLDRLLHHGHVLKFGPRSWRTKTDLPESPSAG